MTRIEAYRAAKRLAQLRLVIYIVEFIWIYVVACLMSYLLFYGYAKLRRKECQVLVVGKGPVAWCLASSLLEKNYDVLLYTPAQASMMTYYLTSNRTECDTISVPSALGFHSSPVRLTRSTPTSRKKLAQALGVSVNLIDRAEKSLFTKCKPLPLGSSAKEGLESAMFSLSSFSYPEARIYRTSLVSTIKLEDGVKCVFSDRSEIKCSHLILADEFPTYLSPKDESVVLGGPVGVTLTLPAPEEKAYARTEVDSDLLYTDWYSDGNTLTLSIYGLENYSSLPRLSYELDETQRSQLSQRIEEQVKKLAEQHPELNELNPIEIKPLRSWLYGLLPGNANPTRAGRDDRIFNLSSLCVPPSSDVLRDCLIAGLVLDSVVSME